MDIGDMLDADLSKLHTQMPIPLKRGVIYGCACLCLAIFLGCTPRTEQEEAYFEQREADTEAQEGVSKALKGSTRQAEAMTMVKEQDAPDNRGTIEDWVVRKTATSETPVMFPRWKVRPKGGEKFDVQFVYSVMGEGYAMTKKGYGWNVDLVLKIVSPHRELSEAELSGSRSRATQVSQQQRRQKKRADEFSLE